MRNIFETAQKMKKGECTSKSFESVEAFKTSMNATNSNVES